MQIDNHDYSGLDGNTEQRYVADPNSDAEVVTEQLLQDESAGERVNRGEDEHRGFGDGVEDHIEEQEDHKEHDGKNYFETLLGALLKFVFSSPLVGLPWLQLELLGEEVVRRFHESAIVFGIEVDVDVTGQGSVLVANHGWAARERNTGNLF